MGVDGQTMINGAILRRPRLIKSVQRAFAPILLLQAPTGFGKTTLIRSWLQDAPAGDVPVVWVSLNADFSDPHAFWLTVIACGRRLGLLSDEGAEELSRELDAHDDPVPVLESFLVDAGPVILVVDAYEKLGESAAEIDRQLLRLTELNRDLRVIVTTRGRTDLANNMHRVRGRVEVITDKDLAFTPKETALFLGAHGTDQARSAADRIHQATRGYPLAVRAASLATSGAGLPQGAADDIGWAGIVAEDLRSQLADEAMVRLARLTSVPPYFSEELAAELTGYDDVKSMLEQLEWDGYGRWIPFAASQQVFQYVETFRDVMRADVMASEPDEAVRSSATAAQWLHEHGELSLALEMAVEGQDYALASRIFMSVLLTSPESYTSDALDQFLSRVPRADLDRHPMLAFARGLALLSNPATRASALPYFVRTAEQTPVDWDRIDVHSSFFLRVAKSASLRYIGRFREGGVAGAAALAFYDEVDLSDDPGFLELRAIGVRQIGYSLFQTGRFDEARRAVGHAIETATIPWSRNYTLVYGVGLSAIEGRSRESANLAALVNPEAWPRDHAHTFVNALGRVGNAIRHLDRFDRAAALAEYDGCESFLHTAEFWPFITWSRLHAHLAGNDAERELRRISEAVDAQPPPPGSGDNFGTAMLRGLVALGWLSMGRYAEAQTMIHRATGWEGQLAPAVVLSRMLNGDPVRALQEIPTLDAADGHTERSRAAMLVLGAAAALRAANPAAAATLLNRSAAIHAAHGTRAHLVHLPSNDLEALRVLAGKLGGDAADYLAGEIPSLSIPEAQHYPTLTERELAVVHALAEYDRRAEVAAALHVSPETVKSQVRSIYRKWRVNSRGSLIERAIELGALDPDRMGRC